MSFTGIARISVPYKIYAYILNQRLMDWLGVNSLLVEEQNGFQKKRGCLYHLYSLNSIISPKCKQKDIYVCLLDMQKAFDSVIRNLLWYGLMQVGI